MPRRADPVAVPPGPPTDDDALLVFYDELLQSRDRLAGLGPATLQDVERALRAMHEVVWYFLTPPPGRKTELDLQDDVKAGLLAAARNRKLDLYVAAVALVAAKLTGHHEGVDDSAARLRAIEDSLDALTFEHRVPKRTVVAALRDVKASIEARLAHVRSSRARGYVFAAEPEAYRDRSDKAEKPDRFFQRVYGADVARGLTQADLRRSDPAFYNVLHVWCVRHEKKMSSFLPPTRQSRSR